MFPTRKSILVGFSRVENLFSVFFYPMESESFLDPAPKFMFAAVVSRSRSWCLVHRRIAGRKMGLFFCVAIVFADIFLT